MEQGGYRLSEVETQVMPGLKIHYFHGFRSGADSGTLRTISSVLSEHKFNCTTVDYEHELEAQLHALQIAAAESDMLIGSSHGGFFADYFARKLKIPAILINPSVYPSTNLAKYGVPDVLLGIYKKLEAERESFVYHRLPRIIILGAQDETLNPSVAEAFYHDTEIIHVDAPHRLPDHVTAEIVPRAIERLRNSPFF